MPQQQEQQKKKVRVMTLKKKPVSAPVVVDSEDDASAEEALSDGVADSAGEEEDVASADSAGEETDTSVASADSAGEVASADSAGDEIAEIQSIAGADWGSTYPSGKSGKVLSQKQLLIAEKEEAESKKNAEKIKVNGKMVQPRMTRPSIAGGFKLEKPLFNEMVNAYTQEDGEHYTKEAFVSAMDYWVYKHIAIGNAYARSGRSTYHKKKDGSNSKEVSGVEMPSGFWDTDFFGGWFNTEEAKEQLEIAEDLQRCKRKGKSPKKVSAEVKKDIVNEAINEMSVEDLMALLALKKKGGSAP
jgi:hypothetical protein